ncbi:VOC family protein [Microbacterium sp. SS28]|uniref:VOC family protein n=1 Tax=Microbacterium sp. SS28 TaxID=2919948 RepID=UPI001FAAB6A8|nr:VOC family protein [Microbacterium sp. SS28]
MSTKIFVNIRTSDLERSKAFYSALGATLNPAFTDDNAACIVWSDDVYFMAVTHDHFATFTDKQPVDPRTHAQVLIALSRDSREEVDSIIEAGVAAGGSEPTAPSDYGFMYSRDLEDPDGNGVEFFYMDPQAAAQGPEVYLAEQAQA